MMRRRIKPMMATLIDEPFDDEEWIFEIKWDGFRAVADVNGSKIDLYSRNLLSFNTKFPLIVEHLKKLKIDAIFDGEIVVVDKKGRSSFQLIQNYQLGIEPETNLNYYIFDILFFEGEDLRNYPLIERKEILKNILKKHSKSPIRYSDHIEKNGKKFFQSCVKHELEGMICKNKTSPYLSGIRSKKWLKVKSLSRQEFVICGFTQPKGTRKNFGSILVGIYEKGELRFAGHVGGGFSEKDLSDLRKKFQPYIQEKCPFKNRPKTDATVTWLKPHFVCEVSFNEWTKEGILRQPIFIGLRTDKPPKQVIKEKPLPFRAR